ncbi:class I SAM-dependent methyltransferase [Pseudoalteromonas aurantia]|uniref:Methyltransferase type 11 domain-containing protein n=1 Tax=Pseudoalteromonas aurantia TaxID=43654 RepID=A0A5S3VA02_9GAMM|nr:class I SAM-dependent methyltransferase [Pseudoalteromonas aurantia]TMO64187.1 hypothetical protein CWC18_07095 [Pseudoalteromonas aurantia]TMO68533.1 hypothetical protein CWC19_08955 [Pseudoalteromonas aurantia]TMO75177.1 hypothetical protein CWC20_08615 [Pseudoalteromonas aurantia]
MKNNAEKLVSTFYKEFGWNTDSDITEDAKKFEDLREFAAPYVSMCRQRVKQHIPHEGEHIIDMASGPVQYPEYVDYSEGYSKRHCVDFSEQALTGAEKKLGEHGEYWCGNFLNMEFEADFFDCAISLHTIYHIDRDEQEVAVNKLLEITKPGKPVIIVYSNPSPIIKYFTKPINFIKRIVPWFSCEQPKELELYVHRHPISWWHRFSDEANVTVLPWRSFAAEHQKVLFPNNRLGAWMFKKLFILEDKYPVFFAEHFQYPMIILEKRSLSRE